MSALPPIAVLASRVRVDEKRLFDALEARGVPWEQVDTRWLWSRAGAPRPPWRAVLNREIGQARALYAAHTLESLGVPVLNRSAATEVCGDKWRTTLALREAGLPHPATALALTPEAGLAALAELGYPAVVKPLVGSWGRLVTPLPNEAVAAAVLEHIAALPGPQSHLVYVQELVRDPDAPGRDLRAVVVGGELLGVTERRGVGFRANVARGARSTLIEPAPELAKLAVAAAAAVDADLAGVDLIEDAAGRLLVLEVNDRLEFGGFQAGAGDRVDVAARIVDHLVAGAAP
ncbi:MAG TPA: RimK family alpha-L-glutamate ligase [Mycobacteriales bacterium]|nr:RimK family alpha-L-glutamate ligase [Mycobacteriales bacterium]